MKKYEKSNAITIIDLIVTIIILLIISGITIISLTCENGLIDKITIAKEKQLESKTLEKLKLKIMELQTNITTKEGRQAVLEDLNNWTNVESDYYDYEIQTVTNSQGNINKLVEIDGYIFEVDKDLNIIGNKEISSISKTETTYQINSINGNVMQVTIKIKNTSGIEKIINPLGNEIVPQVNKTQIKIDYEVISGNNYIFKVKIKGSEEIKEYILKADINAKPEIKQNESFVYPMLTEYGVEINKTVEIDYGENTNNYYSIDNGITWNKYDESFKIKNECILMTKTIIEGEITREDKKKIAFNFADNAVGVEAYDENDSTFFQAGYANTLYMNISSEVWNEPLTLISEGYTGIWFLDKDGNNLYFSNYFSTKDNTYTIPENSTKIKIYSNQGKIYKIGIKNNPVINVIKQYPNLSKEVIEKTTPYNLVEIKYFHTSVKQLYKINDNEWKEYNGEEIKLEKDEKIYAKGIDKYNKETEIVSYISSVPKDSIGFEAYDGDESTFFQAGNAETLYMDVSNDLWNKKLEIITEGYTGIWFLNKNGNSLYFSNYFSTKKDNVYIVPENTTRMKIYSNKGKIYEISIME